jgi:hypothetical protein
MSLTSYGREEFSDIRTSPSIARAITDQSVAAGVGDEIPFHETVEGVLDGEAAVDMVQVVIDAEVTAAFRRRYSVPAGRPVMRVASATCRRTPVFAKMALRWVRTVPLLTPNSCAKDAIEPPRAR